MAYYSTILIILLSSHALFAQYKNYTGKIVELSSNQPIPIATIIIKKDKVVYTDDIGCFDFYSKETDSVMIFAHGYQKKAFRLKSDTFNIVTLENISVHLNEVSIIPDKSTINPLEIIKKVKDSFDKNYYTNLFYQKCYANITIINTDKRILKSEYILDFYNYPEAAKRPWIDFKQERHHLYDSVTFRRLGYVFMSPFQIDKVFFLHQQHFFRSNAYRGYNYTILKEYDDSNWSNVYCIQFVPKRLSYRLTNSYDAKSMVGKMIIRKNDYAIVSIEYVVVRAVDKSQKYAEKYNKDQKKGHFWKVSPDDETFYLKTVYVKDPLVNKYVLTTSTYTFSMRGRNMKTNEYEEQTEVLNLRTIDRPVPLNGIENIQFDMFNKFKAPYSSQFWDTFKIPGPIDSSLIQ